MTYVSRFHQLELRFVTASRLYIHDRRGPGYSFGYISGYKIKILVSV